MTSFSRTALWDWLDAHAVPFRDSVHDLEHRLGTVPNGWREDARDLHLPTQTPLLQGLAAPPSITLDRATQRHRAPRAVKCYIRTHADAMANVDLALTQLSRVFGAPTSSTRNNAISHEWLDSDDAFGRIRLLGFPRSKTFNSGGNRRHAAIKGSDTEASITLSPNFDPPPTPSELRALAKLTPLMPPRDQARLRNPDLGIIGSGFDRGAPKAVTLQAGLWAAPQDQLFVAVSQTGRFLTFSRDEISQVVFDVAKPAKGHGGASVILDITQHGQTRTLGLCRDRFDAPYMSGLADRIAARFERVLTKRDYFDC